MCCGEVLYASGHYIIGAGESWLAIKYSLTHQPVLNVGHLLSYLLFKCLSFDVCVRKRLVGISWPGTGTALVGGFAVQQMSVVEMVAEISLIGSRCLELTPHGQRTLLQRRIPCTRPSTRSVRVRS